MPKTLPNDTFPERALDAAIKAVDAVQEPSPIETFKKSGDVFFSVTSLFRDYPKLTGACFLVGVGLGLMVFSRRSRQ